MDHSSALAHPLVRLRRRWQVHSVAEVYHCTDGWKTCRYFPQEILLQRRTTRTSGISTMNKCTHSLHREISTIYVQQSWGGMLGFQGISPIAIDTDSSRSPSLEGQDGHSRDGRLAGVKKKTPGDSSNTLISPVQDVPFLAIWGPEVAALRGARRPSFSRFRHEVF